MISQVLASVREARCLHTSLRLVILSCRRPRCQRNAMGSEFLKRTSPSFMSRSPSSTLPNLSAWVAQLNSPISFFFLKKRDGIKGRLLARTLSQNAKWIDTLSPEPLENLLKRNLLKSSGSVGCTDIRTSMNLTMAGEKLYRYGRILKKSAKNSTVSPDVKWAFQGIDSVKNSTVSFSTVLKLALSKIGWRC